MSDHPTSPAATGDRGGSFEQLLDVCYLTYLLTQGSPPFMRGGILEEVHLQSGHLDWATEDLLLVGTVAGKKRKVAIQAKSAITLTAENAECIKVFAGAWKDFNNGKIFDLSHDGLALVCGPLPVATYRRWRIMLDAAQAALDPADWLHRLALPGYLKDAMEAMKTLRALLDAANGSPVTDDQLWGFAKAFDFQWLDLMEPGSTAEAVLRSLLAVTATPGTMSPADAASRSWGDLLTLIIANGPAAASYDYAKLPPDLRQRHEKAPSVTAATRKAVREHSAIVERGVRTAISGQLSLPRTDLVAAVQAAWEEHRILCLSGPAGSGKSAVAKIVFDQMKQQGLAVAFRVESFGAPHLNDVFAPHGFYVDQLLALAALHPRKWIWVESVERLLEKSERHAFLDLLRLAEEDPSIRLILTCRDYQVEAIRSSTFAVAGLEFIHVAVPGLSDEELADIARQMPTLAIPLGVPRLRELLRNLFLVEKAAGLDWSDGVSLPQNEREFRGKVWREVIRRDDRPAGGMPQKRATAFIEISMHRAKKLEAFVDASDLDPNVLRHLKEDGLTVSPTNDDSWVAPSHDVLEDWALLEWLTQLWRRHEHDIPIFLTQIGTFPALRRAYRMWLTEWLDSDAMAADGFVLGVLASSAEPHWRDDTLAATLLSSTAADFIFRNEGTLIANDLAVMRQCIHLVRIACKTSPPWLQDGSATNAFPLMPEGPAWGAIVDLSYKHLCSFGPSDRSLLTGLLSDWSLSVTDEQPYPPGADSAAKMANALIPAGEAYASRSDESNQVLAEVMLKVPKPVQIELHERVRASMEDDCWDQYQPGLAAHVLNHFKAASVARDYPDLVIESFESYIGLNAPNKPHEPRYYYRRKMPEAFGLPARLDWEEHMKSAYRGPVLNLLTYHSAKAIDLIINVMNFCADAYGDPDNHTEFIEEPIKLSLKLPDGTLVEQWANDRLWRMYRGTSVAPCVLCSALMALEEWLFRLAEAQPGELEGILLDLLRRSNNVAITGVVCGVAQAYPNQAGMAAVSVLTQPQFFHFDRARFVGDYSNHEKIIAEAFPPLDAEHAISTHERSQSNERDHRRENLETLAVRLQLGQLRPIVHELLDEYLAALPPNAEQDEETKLWRLLLHRIDVRNFTAQTLPDGTQVFQSSDPPIEVQEVVEKHRPYMERSNQRMGVWLWATQCWENKTDGSSDPKEWPKKLVEAQKMDSEEDASSFEDRLEGSAVPQVAAVCIRDHWDDLSPEQRDWCFNCVCRSAAEGADDHNSFGNLMRGSLELNQAAAEVLPVLLGKDLNEAHRQHVLRSLSIVLTHPEDRLRLVAAQAVARQLWESDPEFVWCCVGAIVKEASLLKTMRDRDSEIPYWERSPWDQIEQTAAESVRPMIIAGQPVDQELLLSLPLGSGTVHNLLPVILGTIMLAPPTDQLAVKFFAYVSETFAQNWVWESENGRRPMKSKFDDDREGLDFEKERLLSGHLAQFLLGLKPGEALMLAGPVLDAVLAHPEHGGAFLEQLIISQDNRKPTPTFWALWQGILDRLQEAVRQKAPVINCGRVGKLLGMIFLNANWKPGSLDWPPLAGEAHRLEAAFSFFAPNSAILEIYLVFLKLVGSTSLLPDALTSVAKRLDWKPVGDLITPYSVKILEEILGRFIYSDPAKLKSTSKLRASTLVLLNACIELGSSVCYRQRDDFLTPSAPHMEAG